MAIGPDAEANLLSTVAPERGLARGKFTTALAFVALAALVASYFLFIHRWAVNSIFYDQWWDVQLLAHWYSGKLNLSDLWAQHGENRIFFPNLVVLLLARTVHFNTVFEVYVSGVLMTISTAAILIAHKLRSPSINWLWYLPIAALMMSFVQYQDTLWGFQLAWYMVYFALAVSLFLLDRPRLTWMALGIALVMATVGSYSSIQGLLIWPAGVLLMYQRNRSLRLCLIWLGCGVVVGIGYFYNLSLQEGASSYALTHPVATAKFYFLLIGEVLGLSVPPTPNAGTYAVMAFGVVIFLVACWVVIAFGRHRDETSGAPLGVVITAYGLLFAMLVSCLRVSEGLDIAGTSRYTTFDLLILGGCALTLLSVWEPSDERVRRWWAKAMVVEYVPKAESDQARRPFTTRRRQSSRARAVQLIVTPLVVGLIALQLLVGTDIGFDEGPGWSNVLQNAANATVNGNQSTRTYQINSLLPSCDCYSFEAQLPKLIRVASVRHLSLFGTGAAAMYAKEGLPPETGIPITRIIRPSPGARLSGLVYFDATASDEYGIVRLAYVISGNGFNDVRIATGFQLIYGWLGAWNTSTVPNGNYELRTVVYNVTGKSGRSRPVFVKVDNQ